MVPSTTGSVRIRSTGSSRNPVCGPAFATHALLTIHVLGSINPIERPFTPDDTKDLVAVWKRQGVDQITPNTRRLAKPNAIMFFHMPLYASFPPPLRLFVTLTHCSGLRILSQESYSKADVDPTTGKPLDVGISDLERKGSANGNDGFFDKALMSALESNHRARGVYREVKVVANGHSHGTSILFITTHVDSKLHLHYSDRELPTSEGHLVVFRWWRVRMVSCGPESLKR